MTAEIFRSVLFVLPVQNNCHTAEPVPDNRSIHFSTAAALIYFNKMIPVWIYLRFIRQITDKTSGKKKGFNPEMHPAVRILFDFF